MSFWVILTCFVWFWLVLGCSGSFWVILDQFISALGSFWLVLCRFTSFWVLLAHFGLFSISLIGMGDLIGELNEGLS